MAIENQEAPGEEMKKALMLAGCLLAIFSCSREASEGEPAPVASTAPRMVRAPQVLNLADDFIAFYDETKGQQTEERVAAFKRDVASQFPAFYGAERYEGRVTQEELDADVVTAIENFEALRPAYVAKMNAFDAELGRNLDTFREAFPDFRLGVDVVLLHSLGEMDGGTREFDGKVTLIFGADVMAKVHDWTDEAPFFHHELFHVHHIKAFPECEEVWCALWTEGLAVYVASKLNPGAGPGPLLLEFPEPIIPATQAQFGAALADLRARLSSTDGKDLGRLFSTSEDPSGLPVRRGYYLGFLVAEELGRTRDLPSLAKLSHEEARPLIDAALDTLIARAAAEQ